MDGPGWLTRSRADVPAGDAWLGPAERRVLRTLRFERRRADWRLGRWTAKAAVGAWLRAVHEPTGAGPRARGVAPQVIEILAGSDGAPEAWYEEVRLPVSVSISHREGRGLAVVTGGARSAGCDLEVIETRSDAFIREWLSPSEQRRIWNRPAGERALVANLIWTAKEAAAKARREGLRLDVRHAVVSTSGVGGPETDYWRPLRVDWPDDTPATTGWWRVEPGWVMTVAGEPAPAPPDVLSAPA